jgi:hypothetical protein
VPVVKKYLDLRNERLPAWRRIAHASDEVVVVHDRVHKGVCANSHPLIGGIRLIECETKMTMLYCRDIKLQTYL